jgi:hypothetical protein
MLDRLGCKDIRSEVTCSTLQEFTPALESFARGAPSELPRCLQLESAEKHLAMLLPAALAFRTDPRLARRASAGTDDQVSSCRHWLWTPVSNEHSRQLREAAKTIKMSVSDGGGQPTPGDEVASADTAGNGAQAPLEEPAALRSSLHSPVNATADAEASASAPEEQSPAQSVAEHADTAPAETEAVTKDVEGGISTEVAIKVGDTKTSDGATPEGTSTEAGPAIAAAEAPHVQQAESRAAAAAVEAAGELASTEAALNPHTTDAADISASADVTFSALNSGAADASTAEAPGAESGLTVTAHVDVTALDERGDVLTKIHTEVAATAKAFNHGAQVQAAPEVDEVQGTDISLPNAADAREQSSMIGAEGAPSPSGRQPSVEPGTHDIDSDEPAAEAGAGHHNGALSSQHTSDAGTPQAEDHSSMDSPEHVTAAPCSNEAAHETGYGLAAEPSLAHHVSGAGAAAEGQACCITFAPKSELPAPDVRAFTADVSVQAAHGAREQMVAQRWNVPQASVRVLVGGEAMRDGQSLADVGAGEGRALDTVVELVDTLDLTHGAQSSSFPDGFGLPRELEVTVCRHDMPCNTCSCLMCAKWPLKLL